MDKPALRRRFRAIREALAPEEVAAGSAMLCERLAAWTVLREARTVLTYIAFRNELDLYGAVELLPRIRWVAPRVVKGLHPGEERQLVLHRYDSAHLVRHAFGMLEPSSELPTANPEEVDVVLVPGIAFDRRGGRLGFGGGYYDRFLPLTPALRVGITYDRCLADALPVDKLDQRMDWVVTPTQTIHCAPFWRTG